MHALRRTQGAAPGAAGQQRASLANPAAEPQARAPPAPPTRLAAFGESCSLPIPEIVAIGGQSDGKSSLLEAFLGVRAPGREAGGRATCACELAASALRSRSRYPADRPPHTAPRSHTPQFRFNVREVEMGTRRPLIVQMVHDPAAQQPRCRLQEEDSEEFGPVIPETQIADAIVKRTQDHLRNLGGVSVSGKPIVMRAE